MGLIKTVLSRLLALCAAASAQQAVSWDAPDYAGQFKYIQDS